MAPELALVVSAAVAILAWRLRALTPGGAAVAAAVGTLVLWPAGWVGMAVLGTFFGSSTAIGRLALRRESPDGDPPRETRDARQVVANGAVAAGLAPLEWVVPGLGLWLVTTSLAAAAADTWATGIGSLSRRPPRDILRGGVVAPGSSGGVTWLGSAAGLAGAAVVSLAAVATWTRAPAFAWPVATGIGFLGMVTDSALGAGIQGRFHCPVCDRTTERRTHRCGSRTSHHEGWAWLDNDGVNGLCTLFAAALGWLAWRWWG